MDFIAIDFETANYRPDSACQIGIAVVKNGQITEICAKLIKPPFGGFMLQNVMIHGISDTTVYGEPKFSELWPDIEKYFNPFGFLVAHNMAFDAQVFSSLITLYDTPVPEQVLMCSLIMARKVFPGYKKYGLGDLCKQFDIKFKHHDAGEDAFACAKLTLKIFGEAGITSMPYDFDTANNMQKKLGIHFGELNCSGYKDCRRY